MILWTLVRRTLARHRALIAALAAVLSGFQFVLVLIAVNLQRQGLYSQLAALMPPFVQEALGGVLVASFGGTIALGFFHPVVMLSLSCGAIYLASEPAGEVEHGLVDLIAARPVRRDLLITRSAIVFAGVTTAIVVLMFAAHSAAIGLFAPQGVTLLSRSRLIWVAGNLLAVVWCFGAAALAMAAAARRRGAAAGTTALAALVLYLLQFAAAAWTTLRPLARISPFHYYQAMSTLLGLSQPGRHIAGLLLASLALFTIAQILYARRDL